ncbi:acetyl-CoA C-acetyltransferase [Longimicrobium sp.]|uniref:acetyl-CoA C-acetyltransferase n=1 Tax=Longimicrobium sp. TaxID=2029185 RepID=UPI002C14745A|nr:acetyl-CoA C-acetyltransferase [Longimicrobium sp.]HSU16288.1 acetyl-CoA C-acetyltransferase [Longimicrobium sp.]
MATQGKDTDVVFLSAKRTGMGTFGGALKDFSATDLGVFAAKGALDAAGVNAADVGHVVFGNALQTSADAIYLARHIGLRAGLGIEVPALTLNRLCGSGFQAIVTGAQEILLGECEVALCGGTESMSQAPHVIRGARWGDQRLGPAGKFYEDLLWEALTDPFAGCSMAVTAENLADLHGIRREDVDAYACTSQTRAKAAWDAGHFTEELTPVTIKTRKGETQFMADEHMRPETTPESLGKLKPYFKEGGTVTAGNASGIGDGAAAAVIASAGYAERSGLQPIGRLVSWGIAGVEPKHMGIGPVPASRAALKKAGMELEQMDLVEVNEAFGSQYCAVEKELGLDRERTNVSGGAIALSHPLGASGARITVHLLHELRRQGKRFGLGTACIGGGQGIAVVVEAFPAKNS